MDNDETLQPEDAVAAMQSNDHNRDTIPTLNEETNESHDTTTTTTAINIATKPIEQSTDMSSGHVKRRPRRISKNQTTAASDDASWWQIENENLTLDCVPSELVAMRSTTNTNTNESKSDLETTSRLSSTLARLSRYRKYSENITSTAEKDNSNDLVAVKRTKSESHYDCDDYPSTTETLIRSISKKYSLDCKNADVDNNDEEAEEDGARGGREARVTANAPQEQSLEEFKEELRQKRLARQNAVGDLRDEIATLRKQLATERALTARLRRGEAVTETEGSLDCSTNPLGENDAESHTRQKSHDDETYGISCNKDSDTSGADDCDPSSRSRHANIELANAQLSLQLANSENISLRAELGVLQKQVGTLKEVIACCKQMLAMKEEQCNELKNKLTEIESSFAEREMKIMSDNLRQEYERQLVNIRQLRELYEERQRIAAAEHENLQRLISIKRDELSTEQEKSKKFDERNQTLTKEIESVNNELETLRDECKEHKFEKRALTEEMGAINTLFSQMVMGFNGKNNLDIDRLTTMLEENRTLLNDMATKEVNCSDGATLPKLLFELVEQASVSNAKQQEQQQQQRSPHEEELSEKHATAAIESEDCESSEGEGEDEGEDSPAIKQSKTTNPQKLKVETMSSQASVDGAEATLVKQQTNDAKCCHDDDDDVGEQQQQCNVLANETSAEQEGATAIYYNADESDGAAMAVAASVNSNKNTKRHHHTHRRNASSKSSKASTEVPATLKFHEPEIIGKVASTQEIIGNLPKVWKVLMELLSHHKIEQVQFEENGNGEDCYKSVETPNGPKAELSVSKTYIKLKDLILEKKSLVKETNRLKTLNSHLDYRLNEQEKRLSTVSLELTKTWHLVGKMQRQHRHLHTQEQILRYQLQQKRRLLSELKEELEYCRRKWAAARAKNDESQEQCNDLRREFAKRKLEDANNSAESGYSDSGPPSDHEDEEQSADLATAAVAGAGAEAAAEAVGDTGDALRHRRLKEMFEHTRKIKRMQSSSPSCMTVTDVVDGVGVGSLDEDSESKRPETEIVLRWNSAPPTCGWRRRRRSQNDDCADDENDDDCDEEVDLPPRLLVRTTNAAATATTSHGAIPKQRNGKDKAHNEAGDGDGDGDVDEDATPGTSGAPLTDNRTRRIRRLEEQCKSLIQQVLETSGDREKLEIQLCRYQDAIAPVQYPVPLEEYLHRKRTDRMTRAASVPNPGMLTPREEEYTRKRSERLERLEEESRQLISRIKRTSDRGHYLRCSLDRIRRAPSRESSFESGPEDESRKSNRKSETVDSEAENENASAVAQNPQKLETVHENQNIKGTDDSKKEKKLTSDAKEVDKDENPIKENPLTAEEEAYTARRAARLQRLEEESKQLLTRLSRNAQRGQTYENQLNDLHERYGSSEQTNDTETTNEAAAGSTSLQNQTEGHQTIPPSIEKRLEDINQVTANRAERLRILELEGQELINRLSQTSQRGTNMINRIAEREARAKIKESTNTQALATAQEVTSARDAAVLPLVPHNVACTSIVSEELTDQVTVTTTPCRLAAQPPQLMQAAGQQQTTPETHGAVPKSKPAAELSVARHKAEREERKGKRSESAQETHNSLEDLIKQLRDIPFPENGNNNNNEQKDSPDDESEAHESTEDLAMKPDEKEDSNSEEKRNDA